MATNNAKQALAQPSLPAGSQQLARLRRTLRALERVAPPLAARLALEIFCTPRRKQLEERDGAVMAAARPVAIRHGALALVGYEWGDGPLVVLAHGWESRASRLSGLVEPLVQRGHRVVAFDGPAHGASPGKRTDLVDYGAAIAAALTQFGPVVVVIAHSFGGMATLQALSSAPSVKPGRAVLLASPTEMGFILDGFARTLGLAERTVRGMEHLIAQRYGRPIEAYSASVTAASLELPGLVVHDRDDDVVPFGQGEALVGWWKGAKLVATSGLGHRGILRDAAVIDHVASFVVSGMEAP